MILLQYFMPDGGPRYAETDMSRWIVEPWNTASAAFFVLLAAYWAWRLGKGNRRHLFMQLSLAILGIGSLGGLLYHGLRSSALFLALDWVPILVLSLSTSFYFSLRAWNSWPKAVGIAALGIGLEVLNRHTLPPHISGNITYLLLCALVVGPSLALLYRQRWQFWQWVAGAFAVFLLAVACRFLDRWAPLPMGTHFLWHTFGALACHLMFHYLYRLNLPLSNRLGRGLSMA
jgi:hemolysin III